ncbi:MAG TPA: trypsin-like peptidase domain-containing protein [Baekduia sp.]|nr:trypsin-like peptidase domain-containing protein [Baekduia sp.]
MAGCGGGSTKTVTVGPGTAADTSDGSSSSTAQGLQEKYVQVVQRLSPRVVQIQTSQGLGSGIVYDGHGDIVTNAHVVGTSKKFDVTLGAGDQHSATLVGSFVPDDLAVIKLNPVPSPAPQPAQFADSSKLQVGQLVLAIGNPLGLRSSVTDGIISSLRRTVSEGNGAVIASAVQTSASINPGNSGGALGDMTGAVVGIPTLAAVDPQLGGSAAPGIGFAIPSNRVKQIADQLIADGRVTQSGRAYLGVSVATSVMGQGIIVASVQKGGPADKAGIRVQDTILKVDGKPTPTADDLATVLAGLKPGQKVPVEVRHANGQTQTVQVTLGQIPG